MLLPIELLETLGRGAVGKIDIASRTFLGQYDFKALLRVLIWDTRRNKLYGDQDGTGATTGCSCYCPLTGDLASSACVCGCVVNGVSAMVATRVYYCYHTQYTIYFP